MCQDPLRKKAMPWQEKIFKGKANAYKGNLINKTVIDLRAGKSFLGMTKSTVNSTNLIFAVSITSN